MEHVRLGHLSVSRFIIGGNPFGGFSHWNPQRDMEMRRYFTTERIKQTLAEAERLGVTAHIGRADHHIMRVLLEYWDQGGRIKWIAQTCPELGTIARGVKNAIEGAASACFIHGGVMDQLVASGRTEEALRAIDMIREAGMPAGIAGHTPRVFEWAEQHLDLDFYMCCYYNPQPRENSPEHKHGATETFDDRDRDAMAAAIAGLSRPVIHYKLMASGRNDPAAAFEFAARHLRPPDAVCVGIWPQHKPDMLREDVELCKRLLRNTQAAAAG